MKIKAIVLFFFLTSLILNAQDTISENWKLTKIEEQGSSLEKQDYFTFSKDGKIFVRGVEIANWKLNSSKKELVLKSLFSKDEFNGVHNIILLTKEDFIFSKNELKYFFTRVNTTEIIQNNKSSNLTGTWKLNHNNFDDLFLILKLPNNFTLVSASANSTSSERGEWEYLPKTNELNLIGTYTILKGKSRVKDVSDTFLALVKPQETLMFKKVDSKNIEWLQFTKEELESLTNEEEKLPLTWKSNTNLISSLANFKNLEYSYGNYVKEANAMRYSKIIKHIKINKNKQSISIINKIATKHDTIQFSENHKGNLINQYNIFFPEEEPDYYRVVKNEKLNNYNCTVVEGIIGDKKVKYWMINKQPGVYAKIIEEITDNFYNEKSYKTQILTNKK